MTLFQVPPRYNGSIPVASLACTGVSLDARGGPVLVYRLHHELSQSDADGEGTRNVHTALDADASIIQA